MLCALTPWLASCLQVIFSAKAALSLLTLLAGTHKQRRVSVCKQQQPQQLVSSNESWLYRCPPVSETRVMKLPGPPTLTPVPV